MKKSIILSLFLLTMLFAACKKESLEDRDVRGSWVWHQTRYLRFVGDTLVRDTLEQTEEDFQWNFSRNNRGAFEFWPNTKWRRNQWYYDREYEKVTVIYDDTPSDTAVFQVRWQSTCRIVMSTFDMDGNATDVVERYFWR